MQKRSLLSAEARNVFGVSAGSEINQDVHARKMTRVLKVRIKEEQELTYYLCNTHQLRGYRPCFIIIVCKNILFLRKRINNR